MSAEAALQYYGEYEPLHAVSQRPQPARRRTARAQRLLRVHPGTGRPARSMAGSRKCGSCG